MSIDSRMIPLNACIDRRLYRVHARNFSLGVFHQAVGGFIGIRSKFDDEYPFTEYHVEASVGLGTVAPIAALPIILPAEIALVEHTGLVCFNCHVAVHKTESGSYSHDAPTDCVELASAWQVNKPLFDWLKTATRWFSDEADVMASNARRWSAMRNLLLQCASRLEVSDPDSHHARELRWMADDVSARGQVDMDRELSDGGCYIAEEINTILR